MSAITQFNKLAGGALYDGYGKPITDGAPEWEGRRGLVHRMPFCMLRVPENGLKDGTADLIYALPQRFKMRADTLFFREIMAAIEREEVIAFHATSEADYDLFVAMGSSVFGGSGNA